MTGDISELQSAARARWRVALVLTIIMLVVYFGFVLLAAFGKTLMGTELFPGLSLGILLGALAVRARRYQKR